MENTLKNAEIASDHAEKIYDKARMKLYKLIDSSNAIDINKKLSSITIDNITSSKIRSFSRIMIRHNNYTLISEYFNKDGFYFHVGDEWIRIRSNITLEQFTKINKRVKIIGGADIGKCYMPSPLKLKIYNLTKPIKFKTIEEMYNFIKEYVL